MSSAVTIQGKDSNNKPKYIKTDANGNLQTSAVSSTGVAQTINADGSADVNIYSVADLDSEVSLDHIASGTTPTGSVTAGSWIDRSDYDNGVIVITIVDGTPAGDLAGEFQISYSLDAGVTSTDFETLVAVANIGADDSQTLIVDFSSIKNAPYFKVKEVMTGTLAAVTFGVKVYERRFRG